MKVFTTNEIVMCCVLWYLNFQFGSYYSCDLQQRFLFAQFYRPTHLSNACAVYYASMPSVVFTIKNKESNYWELLANHGSDLVLQSPHSVEFKVTEWVFRAKISNKAWKVGRSIKMLGLWIATSNLTVLSLNTSLYLI